MMTITIEYYIVVYYDNYIMYLSPCTFKMSYKRARVSFTRKEEDFVELIKRKAGHKSLLAIIVVYNSNY
jgi:hypothetical protein